MDTWKRSLRLTGAILAVAVGAVVMAFVLWGPIERALCSAPAAMMAPSPAASCFEFWFNRYQSFITGIFTLVAALIAYVGIRQQIGEDRRIAIEARKAAEELSTRDYRERWGIFIGAAEAITQFVTASVSFDRPDIEPLNTEEELAEFIPKVMQLQAMNSENRHHPLFTIERNLPSMRPADQPVVGFFMLRLNQIQFVAQSLDPKAGADFKLQKELLFRAIAMRDELTRFVDEQQAHEF